MALYRKFWLVNANGIKFELTNHNSKIFLNSPSGIGFKKSLTTTRLGNEENILTEVATMPQISGQLLFFSDTNAQIYQKYQDFIQFAKIKPLKLYYQTPNTFDGWYIDCVFSQLDKGEIDKNGILKCPFVLYGTSFWKTAIEHDLVVENVQFDGKTYPYTYPYRYGGNTYANTTIINNGTLDCGFKFEVNNAIQNPTLSLYEIINDENVKYGEIKINGTYDVVKVDTSDSKQSIYLELNGSVIANPTAYFDLSSNGTYSTPFPKLKAGTSKLSFTFGGTFTQPFHIKWQDVFLTI